MAEKTMDQFKQKMYGIYYRTARKPYHFFKQKIGLEQSPMDAYKIWMNENEAQVSEVCKLKYNPIFSVVIPVYNVDTVQLKECIESVLNQTYESWELILVDDASTWSSVRSTLRAYEKNPNIKIIYREKNGHISHTTNDGIKVATGDYIVFSDCDDVLAVNALYEVAVKLNENPQYDFIYSDEDKLSEDGTTRHSPFFKPEWSPDTFMSLMYTNHLGVYRRLIVDKIGGLRSEYNGAQDYDFTLRFMENSSNDRVGHIPKVLYHWRERAESAASNPEAKQYALDAASKAKVDALKRRGLEGNVVFVPDIYQYRVEYINKNEPFVSIIIPSKDNYEMLKRCISSLNEKTSYKNYEIIVIDNGSREENKKKIEQLSEKEQFEYYYQPMEFNFSRMCNIGASYAMGEYFLFLNDDMEILQPRWLELMVGHASLEHVGAVGAKLYYPNSKRIQHTGVINLEVGPSHALLNSTDDRGYYFGRNRIEYNYLAVTGACLMLSKKKFVQVAGFDEQLQVAYNDVDLCFKLYQAGYYNVTRNDAILYHHESASRGLDHYSPEKMERLLRERDFLYSKHPNLKGYDPFYSIHLAGNRVDFAINAEESHSYNQMTEFNVSNRHWLKSNIRCSIDNITNSGDIVITGWGFIPGYKNNDKSHLYVLLIGNNGERHKVSVNRVERPDVQQAFGDTRHNLRSGFVCTIDSKQLSLQETEYEVGLYIKRNFLHSENVIMTDKKICRTEKQSLESLGDTAVIKEVSLDGIKAGKIIGCIDRVKESDLIEIEGWAVDQRTYYNDFYHKNIMLLTDDKAYEICSEKQERLDVVREMKEYPNITYAGVKCSVDRNLIKEYGSKFKIGILLSSKLNQRKCYIITDKKISLDM